MFRPAFVISVVVFLVASTAASQRLSEGRPDRGRVVAPTAVIPAQARSAVARIWLARAVFGEGGTVADESAIPWTLLRRWQASEPRMHWGFVRFLRTYCSPVKAELAGTDRLAAAQARGDLPEIAKIMRRRWVQHLPLGAGPVFFRGSPAGAAAIVRWRRVVATVTAWQRGEVDDVCPGADHWDEPRSRQWVRLRRVHCSARTGNTFYSSTM
jgi:hypothetical protein